MIVLKGKNFLLRPVRISDAKDYYEKHDKVVAKMFMSVPKDIKEARKEIFGKLADEKKGLAEHFVIEIDGKFAGMVSLDNLSKERKSRHRAKVDYFLGKEYRNKGIMTEAIRLLTKYAFKKYKLKRITASTRSFNKASRRMLENAGFKLEGILRKNKWKNGRYLDDCVYARVR